MRDLIKLVHQRFVFIARVGVLLIGCLTVPFPALSQAQTIGPVSLCPPGLCIPITMQRVSKVVVGAVNLPNVPPAGEKIQPDPPKSVSTSAPPPQPPSPSPPPNERMYERVFVLGNSITSITITPADQPKFGWTGNWGMAASAANKDYYNLLSAKLLARSPATIINTVSGGGFELAFDTYDYDKSLWEHVANKPDLIVVRIGENINDASVLETNKSRSFETAYNQLLDYLVSKGAPNVKIVCTTSFWNHPNANAVIRRVAGQRGYGVADLSVLAGRPECMATQFEVINPAVAAHPNDAGMARIAEIIWDQLK